jgi:hypothetical protein
MLDLEPLVARLVDDVLRAIGRASLAELDRLSGPSRAETPRPGNRVAERAPARERRATPREPHEVAVRPAAPGRARAASKKADRPGVADITDPERLLSAVLEPTPGEVRASAPSAAAVSAASAPASEPEAPALHERSPDRGIAHLRAGESVARVSGAGVVIRRAKRV